MYACMYARNFCMCRVMSFGALSAPRLGEQGSYAGATLAYAGSCMYVCMYACIYARNSCICRVISFLALSCPGPGKQASNAGATLAYAGSYVCMYVCMYVCIYHM